MESREPETLTTSTTTRTTTTEVTSRPSVNVRYTQSRNGKSSTETQSDDAPTVAPEQVPVITLQKVLIETVHTMQSGETTYEHDIAAASTVRKTTEEPDATEMTRLLENSSVIYMKQQQHQESSARPSTSAVPSSDQDIQTCRAKYGTVIATGYLNADLEFKRATSESVKSPPPDTDVLDLTLAPTYLVEEVFYVIHPIVKCDICKQQMKPIFVYLSQEESFMYDNMFENFHEVRLCKTDNNLKLAHWDCMKQARTKDDGCNYFFSIHEKTLPILQWRLTKKFFKAMAIMIFIFTMPIATISLMLYIIIEWYQNNLALQLFFLAITVMIIFMYIIIIHKMIRVLPSIWQQWLDSNRKIKLIIWKPSKNKYLDQSSV